MNTRTFLIVCIIACFSTWLKAQNDQTDSLTKLLTNKEMHDSSRMLLHYKLLRIYSDYDSAGSALHFAETKKLAQKLNDHEYEADAHYTCAIMYLYSGFPTVADSLLKQAYTISEKHKYLRGQAKARLGMGMLESMSGLNDKAIVAFEDALKISQACNDNEYTGAAYNALSISYGNLGENEKALYYGKKNLEIQLNGGKKEHVAVTYNSIGVIYYALGNYPAAMEQYHLAMKINEENKFKRSLSRNYNNIGIIHFEQEEYREALELYEKAFVIKKEINDLYGMAYSESRIGEAYLYLNQTEKALVHLENSLQQRIEIGNYDGQARSLTLIANVHQQTKNWHAAKDTLRSALALFKRINRKAGVSSTLNALGNTCLEMKQYQEALVYLKQGERLNKEIQEQQSIQRNTYLLAEVYSKLGKYKEAFDNLKIHKSLSDSLRNDKNTKKITQEALRYKFDKEKAQIQLRNKEKQQEQLVKLHEQRYFTYIFGLLFAAAAIIGLLFYRTIRIKQKTNKKLKEQKEEILTQADALKNYIGEVRDLTQFKENTMQMLVHDLKNPLNTLLHFPEELAPKERDALRINTAHNMLGLVLNILDVKKVEKVGLKLYRTELSLAELWFEAIAMQEYSLREKNIETKYISEYDYILNVDKSIIQRVIANLLSNAIAHTPNGGRIEIAATPDSESMLRLVLKDNGVGMPDGADKTIFDEYQQAAAGVKYSTGIGLTFCKIAINYHKGNIEIDSAPEQGTEVVFTLPFVGKKNIETAFTATKVEVELNADEIEFLQPFHEKLLQCELHEISDFMAIFNTIQASQRVNSTWLTAVQDAAFLLDSDKYKELLGLIKT